MIKISPSFVQALCHCSNFLRFQTLAKSWRRILVRFSLMYTMPGPWKIWLLFWFLRLLRTPYNSLLVRYGLNLTIIVLGLLAFLPVNILWQTSILSRRIVTLSAFYTLSVITCSARFSSVFSGIPCISKLCLQVYCSRPLLMMWWDWQRSWLKCWTQQLWMARPGRVEASRSRRI